MVLSRCKICFFFFFPLDFPLCLYHWNFRVEVLPFPLCCSSRFLHVFFSASSPSMWRPHNNGSHANVFHIHPWIVRLSGILLAFHECVLNFFELYTSAQTLMREIPWLVSYVLFQWRTLPTLLTTSMQRWMFSHKPPCEYVGGFLWHAFRKWYRIYTALVLQNAARMLVSSNS